MALFQVCSDCLTRHYHGAEKTCGHVRSGKCGDCGQEVERLRCPDGPRTVTLQTHLDVPPARVPSRMLPTCLGPYRMDAPDGPVCSCGRPSRHQSGWCGTEC
jgi:hypothetical protein